MTVDVFRLFGILALFVVDSWVLYVRQEVVGRGVGIFLVFSWNSSYNRAFDLASDGIIPGF